MIRQTLSAALLATATLLTAQAGAAPLTVGAQLSMLELAATEGRERREERRDSRQDCREDNGMLGKDKRDCKRDGDDDQPQADSAPANDQPTEPQQ